MTARVWNESDPEPRGHRMSEPTSRTWDMGDTIPADALSVRDGTDGDCDGCSPGWGRTYEPDEWKGYKDGGKCYLSTAELLRRWGPVTEVVRVS